MAKSVLVNRRRPAQSRAVNRAIVSKDENKPSQKRDWRNWVVKGGVLFFMIKGMLWLAAGMLAWQSMP